MSPELKRFHHRHHFGEQVRAIRKRMLLSQKDLAKRMGISQVAVSQMERQERPRARTVRRAAAALRVKIADGGLVPPWIEEA